METIALGTLGWFDQKVNTVHFQNESGTKIICENVLFLFRCVCVKALVRRELCELKVI